MSNFEQQKVKFGTLSQIQEHSTEFIEKYMADERVQEAGSVRVPNLKGRKFIWRVVASGLGDKFDGVLAENYFKDISVLISEDRGHRGRGRNISDEIQRFGFPRLTLSVARQARIEVEANIAKELKELRIAAGQARRRMIERSGTDDPIIGPCNLRNY